MATYNITTTAFVDLEAGDILNCPYTGSVTSVTLPAGKYTLQCWGASGNRYNSTAGIYGKGGYSTGVLNLTEQKTIYCYVGGQGIYNSSVSTSVNNGGFNGGGGAYSRASSGGGASDIRIGTDSLYARVIVAGGGGGASYSGNNSSYNVITAGAGGGTQGTAGGYGSSNNTSSTYAAQPGTQTAAGTNSTGASTYATTASFGQGATAGYYSQNYASGGAGGGWYGGGVGRSYYAGGAGGSGYVYTSSTKSNYPNGCLLDDSMLLTSASTTAGTSSFVGTGNSNETGHDGDGYIRITVVAIAVEEPSNILYVKNHGAWIVANSTYTKNHGNWAGADITTLFDNSEIYFNDKI